MPKRSDPDLSKAIRLMAIAIEEPATIEDDLKMRLSTMSPYELWALAQMTGTVIMADTPSQFRESLGHLVNVYRLSISELASCGDNEVRMYYLSSLYKRIPGEGNIAYFIEILIPYGVDVNDLEVYLRNRAITVPPSQQFPSLHK